MRYKKIEILNSQDEFIPQDELDKKLKEFYRYSLLNFAFVIADVLAGNSVFSHTHPFGKKKSEFENEIKELGEIKAEIIKRVEKYIRKFYSPDSVRVLSNLNPEKREKFYISRFKLKPPFNYIDDTIKGLEEIVNFRDVYPYETSQPVITQALITQAYWPFFGRYRRPFSSANQVSFLLASVMKDKNGIHWKNICNFICWFLANLDGSFYESKLDFPHGKGEDSIGGNTIVLKNQYQKIKGLFCYSKSSDEYFPQKDNRPQKPYLISNPVISVKFYKNKIKTIYRENDKLKVRESLFENDKENNVIREYEKDEEKNESSKPLMEIA